VNWGIFNEEMYCKFFLIKKKYYIVLIVFYCLIMSTSVCATHLTTSVGIHGAGGN